MFSGMFSDGGLKGVGETAVKESRRVPSAIRRQPDSLHAPMAGEIQQGTPHLHETGFSRRVETSCGPLIQPRLGGKRRGTISLVEMISLIVG